MVNAFFGGLAAGAAQGLTDYLNEERKRASDIVDRAADYQLRTNISRREKRQQDVEKYENALKEMTALTGSEQLTAALLKNSNSNFPQAKLTAERLYETAQTLGQSPVVVAKFTEDPNITVDITSIAGSLAEPLKNMNLTAQDLVGLPKGQTRYAERLLGRIGEDIIQPEEEEQDVPDYSNIPDIDDTFLTLDANTNYLQRGRLYADLAIQLQDSDSKRANEYAAKSKEAFEIAQRGKKIEDTNKYTTSQVVKDSDRFAAAIATRTGQEDKIIQNDFGPATYQSDWQAALLRREGARIADLIDAALSKGMRYGEINLAIEEIIYAGYIPVLKTTDEGVTIGEGKDLYEMFKIKRPPETENIVTPTDTPPTQTGTTTTTQSLNSEGRSDIKKLEDIITDATSSQTKINAAVEALVTRTGKTEDQIRREYNLN